MNPIISNFIKQAKIADNQAILDAAIKYYDNNDPDDPKHRWDHVLDTMEVAKKIRGRELTPQEFGMLAFHDSGYKHPKGYSYSKKIHGPLGARIFRKEAPGLGYSKDEIKHIAKVIAYHNHQPKAKSNLLNDDLQLLMYSADEGTPMDIEEDAVKYYKKGLAGVYKGVDPKSKEFIKQLVGKVRSFGNLTDAPRLKYYHEIWPTYHQDLYDYWHSDRLEKLYNKLYRKKKEAEFIDFPKEELPSLLGKDKIYTTRVSKDYNKYKLGDEVITPWDAKYYIDEEELYDNVDKHRFRDELTPEQVKLLKKYKKIKLLGLKKKASKLYTYVDPDADLSLGVLSARNAPEEALMKRYKGKEYAKSKKDIINFFESIEPGRSDKIYALESPIPDNANPDLLNFRDTHKLVSYDPTKLKKLIKILKRRTSRPPVETTADFEPRKHVQWGRDPRKVMRNPGRGFFHYAPVMTLITEDGRIPPELLEIEK